MTGTQPERIAPASPGLVDWPTIAAIVLFWLALLAVAVGSSHLPTIVVLLVLASLGGFYMSLQHEVIHGHPTRSVRLNWSMIAVPLGMTQPYARYREIHVAHHRSDITDPVDDPESYYVLPSTWAEAGPVQRAVLSANRTLLGRLAFGPLLSVFRTAWVDGRLARSDRSIAKAWGLHVIGFALVLTAVRATGLPLWMYMVGFVYGGAVTTSLRSFVEHRAVASTPRSAVVHAGWFFSLMFLNNNLHYTHHQLPGAAWYRLPELTEALDADAAVADGAGSYDGYFAIARQYLLRPFDQPVHPLSDPVRR